jgi:opacity protein-like surface antigen
MSTRKLNYALGLLLAGVLSTAALADETAAKGEFYVNPGIALTGAGASDYKNSFSLDAAYLKAVHQVASIGWEAGYLFGSKFENDSFTSDASLKILHLAPEIKIGPTFAVSGLQLNTFVLGGGGFYWSHQDGGTQTFTNGTTSALSASDRYNGGWNIGAGAALQLPGNWSVGVEVRRHEIVNKHADDFTWVTPALRFSLLFT